MAKGPEQRFQQIQRWCLEDSMFMHTPTILVKDIADYPSTISYIKEQTQEGRMDPQIHGYVHEDYGRMTKEVISEHLSKCKEWFDQQDLPAPTLWYTPWGANNETIQEAGAEAQLRVVGVSPREIAFPGAILDAMRRTNKDLATLLGPRDIFMHWWERGNRVRRVISAGKFVSIANAQRNEPELWGV